MRLKNIVEGRKNIAYKSAVVAGTEIVYEQGGVIIRKLTTPEALQYWSRHSCPAWYIPDPHPQPPCTVVLGNAIESLKRGPHYYCEINNKPIYLANPNLDTEKGTVSNSDWTFLDYRSSNYSNGRGELAALIKKLNNDSSQSKAPSTGTDYSISSSIMTPAASIS